MSRDRVSVEATRLALRDDLQRARRGLVTGGLTALLGAGIATFASVSLHVTFLVFGLVLAAAGLMNTGRAGMDYGAARRRLRAHEERTALPVARVVTD